MDAPENQLVWLARIRRPQGRKGEVFAEILTDFPGKFAERRRLWLVQEAAGSKSGSSRTLSQSNVSAISSSVPAAGPRAVELLHYWLHKGGIVLHFEGMQSISDAETLSDWIVAVPQEERAPLDQDEVYISDLIGCQVIDVMEPDQPRMVGIVSNVEREAGPVPLLLVKSGQAEVMIPFAKAFLRLLNPAGKRIEMALPEGLVDLNG